MKRVVAPWILSLAVLSGSAPAQQPESPNREAMKKLQFLVGKWQGKSSIRFGAGEPQQTAGTEIVRSKQGGTLLVIEGRFTAKVPGQDKPRVVHDALGIVSYDAKNKRYRFHAYRNGNLQESELTLLGESSVRWGFKQANGSEIRFTLRIDKDQWKETGEVLQGGKVRATFMEMSLQREKSDK